MGNNTFDAILTSVPLNSTAAKVTARGEHWVPETPMPPGLLHWKNRPLLRPYVPNRLVPNGDLTGRKFGRFTVVGVLNDDGGGKNRGDRWVCKCVCGDYEARTARAVKMAVSGLGNPITGTAIMCFYCSQWQSTQNRYKKKGARPLSEFTASRARIIEAKKPEEIIADHLPSEEQGLLIAAKIIAALNSRGYRIVREQHRHVVNEGESPSVHVHRE